MLRTRDEGVSARGGVTTVQWAEITLPRAELEGLWSPEYLERLARTYWLWIGRISLGLLRVLYSANAREVVLLGRPLVLLRFFAPEYDVRGTGGTVTWRINRGILVAPAGRGEGYLRMDVERRSEDSATGDVTLLVTSKVANFYPAIRGWGWFSRIGWVIYRFTQLKIHVLVTNAFFRSLANLDLAPSVVGNLRGSTPGVPDAEEFEAVRRLRAAAETAEPGPDRELGEGGAVRRGEGRPPDPTQVGNDGDRARGSVTARR